MIEQILVMPTEAFDAYQLSEGFTPDGMLAANIVNSDRLEWRVRDSVEEDTDYRQIVSYDVFIHRVPGGGRAYFAYERTEQSGESRLRGKMSIGVGGHINLGDSENPVEAFPDGRLRELTEEVGEETVDNITQFVRMGVVWGAGSPVQMSHVGIVTFNYVDYPWQVQVCDSALNRVGFVTKSYCEYHYWDKLEYWSQAILRTVE